MPSRRDNPTADVAHHVLEIRRQIASGSPHHDFCFGLEGYSLRSHDGQERNFDLDWSQELLDDLGALRTAPRPETVAQKLGATLRDAIAAADWAREEEAIFATSRRARRVHLTIRLGAAELYAFPWELLTHPATGQHLADLDNLLIRYEWPGTVTTPASRELTGDQPGRILMAWSGAGGLVPDNRHAQAITSALAGARDAVFAFDPDRDVIPEASCKALVDALDDDQRPVSILHLLCHGTAENGRFGLCLSGPDGLPDIVDASQLRRILGPHAATIRLVMLSACDGANMGEFGNHLGGIAQSLHRVGIQCVVASRYLLSVAGSTTFVEFFYRQALASHASFDEAFLNARNKLGVMGETRDWIAMQLFSRASGTGDAWDPQAAEYPQANDPELSRGNIRPLRTEAIEHLAGPAPVAAADDAPVAIRWLHLSDLHAGAPGQAMWHQVFEEFARDIGRMGQNVGPPDLVLFTGDLTFSGREYDKVDGVLGQIRARLREVHGNATQPLLFAVPGNHDVARPGKLRDYLVLSTYGSLGEEVADKVAHELFEELWIERDASLIEPLFADYQAWMRAQVEGPLRDSALSAYVHASYFPGDISALIDKRGFRLGLVGLNSAWLHYTSGDFNGRLHIPPEQFHRALSASNDNPLAFFDDCDSALLLMHHPPSWLHERARRAFDSSIFLPERFDLCLYGHLHAARSEVIAVSGTQPRAHFQAPSLFGLEHYGKNNESRSFGYTWGEIRSDGGLRVWPRVLIERGSGRWSFDRDQRFDDPADDGAVWLRRPRPRPRPVPTSPGDVGSEVGSSVAQATREVSPGAAASASYEEALREYIARALAEYRYIDMAGLGYGRMRVELNDVYVPLRFYGCVGTEGTDGRLRTGRALHRLGDREVDLLSAFTWAQPARHLFIQGDPGAGKTTALKKLMWSIVAPPASGNGAGDGQPDGSVIGLPPATVPVFLRLRELDESYLRKNSFGDFLDARLRAQESAPEGFGAWLWTRGHLLLLLDGLDEMADPGRRARTCEYLERQLAGAATRGIRAVVSCRFAGLSEGVGFGSDFAVLAIHPMDDEQIEALLTRWFEAAEVMAARASDADIVQAEAKGRARGAELAARLREPEYMAPQLLELVSNPLLLTLLCVVVFDGREIPRERKRFFDDCLRTLLDRWRRGLVEAETPWLMSYEDALELLQPVAWTMHVEARKYDLDRARLERLMRPEIACIEGKLRSVLPIGQVINWLKQDAGVLTEYAPGEFGFMHLSLQEYLAAHHAAVLGEEGVARLASEFGSEWWREVTLLFVALDRHRMFGKLMAGVIAAGKLASERELVRQCLDEAHQPELDELLTVAEDAERAGVEREAAVSLLTQHERDERVARTLRRVRGTRRFDGVLEHAETGIRLLWIPGGEFEMGLADVDPDWKKYDEWARPVHRVRVSPFWLGEVPVTNRQYEVFMKATGYEAPKYWRDRRLNKPVQPVVGVSWDDAQAFCAWLSEQTGWAVELPSEAQWEFAARGSDNRLYTWGNEPPDQNRAHFEDRSGPLPVGSLSGGRGPFGILDQAGNVWEWCRDGWDEDAYKRRGAQTVDPYTSVASAEPAAGRPVRGGSWYGPALYLRSAYRGSYHALDSFYNLGLRVSSSPAAGGL